MKHISSLLGGFLLALLSFCPLAGRAQSASAGPLDSLRHDLDYLLAPLDKSQVPTAYLAEAGIPFLPLRPFNGTLSDTCVLTLPQWRQLYATVFSSQVQALPDASLLPLLGTLNAELAQRLAAAPAGAIPLLVQRLDYAALRPDAVSAGLLTLSGGQLHDVPGCSQSPYLARTLFAAVPGRNVSTTGAVSFVFAPSLYVQRGGGGVQALSIDFGDGQGYRPATWNQPVGTSYCAAGTYRVKVRVAYSVFGNIPAESRPTAGQRPPAPAVSYESQFDLHVLQAGCSAARYADYQRVKRFPATSAHSGAYVYLRYGGTTVADTVLDKPLIVAEGYDPYHAAPALGDNLSINDFLEDIGSRTSGSGTTSFNFYDWLEHGDQAGNPISNYDILYIDYNNGTDDIRRNAALFEEVVRWVNANKVLRNGMREKNVVMGISMGGLVARYGLAEMVKNPQLPNNDPDTRLLITHDSPHHGANTPLGVQALVRLVSATHEATTLRNLLSPTWHLLKGSEILPELAQANKLIDEPASRQLLLVRMQGLNGIPFTAFNVEYNTFIENDYRTMITPPSGQSFPYAFIATSLGSQCGQELFAPHTELLRIDATAFISPLHFPIDAAFQTHIVVNALPAGGQIQRILNLMLWAQPKMFGITLPRHYYIKAEVSSPASNPIALDGLAGGTQPLQFKSLKAGHKDFDLLGLGIVYGDYDIARQPSFCFVPTASALDVATFNDVAAYATYINNSASAVNKPAAPNFIAQASYTTYLTSPPTTVYNVEHPRFPVRQAQWLYDQMEGLQLEPVMNLRHVGRA